MNKISHLLSVAIILAIVGLSSCHKDNPQPSKMDLISAKTWKLTGATISGTDVFSSFDNCVKDNLITFAKNGTYTEDEGATKCNQSDPQTTVAQWSFQKSETEIDVSYPDNTVEKLTIVSLSATTLSVTYAITSPANPGTSITVAAIFTAQ